jgi:two-component system, OmpR family, KDP operon response regulator KdpE
MRREAILVVDDEPPMRKYLSANLRARGYWVSTAEDGTEALQCLAEHSFDLLILDIMMPGPDGLALLKVVRDSSSVPVLILSARGREADKVQALDLGADDYLTKPFGVEELLARVRAALRRADNSSRPSMKTYRRGSLEIDFNARQARLDSAQVSLTQKEYQVLAYLARNAGKVLTHRQILHAVWGGEYGDEADYLWTYIRRLRRKLDPDPHNARYLLTEPGVGYHMPAPD